MQSVVTLSFWSFLWVKKNQIIFWIQLEQFLKYTEQRDGGRKITDCGLHITSSLNHSKITAGPKSDLTTVLHEKKQMGEWALAKSNKSGIWRNQNIRKELMIHGLQKEKNTVILIVRWMWNRPHKLSKITRHRINIVINLNIGSTII